MQLQVIILAEQQSRGVSIHWDSRGEGGVTADYSAKWSPPPALLLLLSTNIITQHNALQCSVLIITSTPKLNQKECGPKPLHEWRVCTALHCANLGHVCRRKFALATGQETGIRDCFCDIDILHLQGFELFPLVVGDGNNQHGI